MSNKKKTVKELNAEFELLAERVKKLKEKDTSEVSGNRVAHSPFFCHHFISLPFYSVISSTKKVKK
jgi:hypothetical protein